MLKLARFLWYKVRKHSRVRKTTDLTGTPVLSCMTTKPTKGCKNVVADKISSSRSCTSSQPPARLQVRHFHASFFSLEGTHIHEVVSEYLHSWDELLALPPSNLENKKHRKIRVHPYLGSRSKPKTLNLPAMSFPIRPSGISKRAWLWATALTTCDKTDSFRYCTY